LFCFHDKTRKYTAYGRRRIFRLVRKIEKIDHQLRNICPSVRPHGTNRLPMEGFSFNFIFEHFFENLLRKFKFLQNLTRTTDTLHEDRYTYIIVPRSILLRMTNISSKLCRENQNTFLSNKYF
jgi:hypothetical protein